MLGGDPGMACLCQAVSRPNARRGVMDCRIEPTRTPWKDWEVISGFMALRLRDVEGRMTSCSIWNTPPGALDDVFTDKLIRRAVTEGVPES